jgi:hypothetical protein
MAAMPMPRTIATGAAAMSGYQTEISFILAIPTA